MSELPPKPSMRPSNAPEEALPRGATIGRYVVVGVVGHGAMGVVYAAYDTQLDRKLAIKLLRNDLSGPEGPEEVESRMLREAQAMARLTHPNVVAVFDVGTFDHRVFLAMEYIDGWTLKEWLKTGPSWRRRLEVLQAAGRGLAAAHAVGLVHRDFKPDNVLVGRDGRVLVTDFGLARMAEADPEQGAERRPRVVEDLPVHLGEASISSPLDAPLTLTGDVLGTVGYMPLEQVFGETTNALTDQFSFCATAYVALYEARPFSGDDLHAYVASLQRPLREPPRGTTVPRWIERILARGLSQEASDRFPSMAALLAALAADPAVRRRRVGVAGAIAVGLALVGWGVARGVARQASECAVDPSELAGAWDPGVNADVHQAFVRAVGPSGTDAAERVGKVLNDTAAKWLAMRGEVCEAERVRHQQTPEVRKLRDECLDRRRTELHELTALFRGADAQVVKRSLDAAYGLTNVGFCADVQGLRASAGLPDDPTARARVLEAREHLARAATLGLAGKYKEELAEAETALSVARQSGQEGALAESLYVVGSSRRDLGDYVGAEAPLTEATWTAMAAGTDATTARAAGMTAFVLGAKLRRTAEAHVWLGVAEAALRHLGGSDEIEADVGNDKSAVLAEGDWQPEQAIAIGDRIIPTYERIYGVHPKTARAIYAHGVDYSYLGEHATAQKLFEQALGMYETIGGPEYFEVGRASYVLGDSLVAQGEYARGEQSLQRAIGIFDRSATPYWSAITFQSLVRAKLAQGENEAALDAARRSLDFMSKLPPTPVLVPIVDVPAADALMATGHDGEALPLCEAALSLEEQTGQLEPKKVLGWDALRCKAEALLRTGAPRDAIPLLERSLTLPRRIYPTDLARVRFDLARALAATQTDPARALALATQARSETAAFPFRAADLAAIDRWLGERNVRSERAP